MSAAPTAPPLGARRFVLATDLDGTFLGGTAADRRSLYRWIETNRETVGLIFVTGRDPEFIAGLCGGGDAPWPEFVVGDVGTSVAEVDRHAAPPIRPIEVLEADIAARWDDAGPRVRAALEGHPGLRLQPTEFRFRVSYDMDPARFDPGAVETVAALGLDHLISNNQFFDVLPRGVSKGPTLRRLLDHLGVAAHRVLVAGDTLNDLSMLDCGLPAVAVGGSEPALLERLAGRANVHAAEAIGAAGIVEAIRHFGLYPIPQGGADAL